MATTYLDNLKIRVITFFGSTSFVHLSKQNILLDLHAGNAQCNACKNIIHQQWDYPQGIKHPPQCGPHWLLQPPSTVPHMASPHWWVLESTPRITTLQPHDWAIVTSSWNPLRSCHVNLQHSLPVEGQGVLSGRERGILHQLIFKS